MWFKKASVIAARGLIEREHSSAKDALKSAATFFREKGRHRDGSNEPQKRRAAITATRKLGRLSAIYE
jgi:hypothetical protein